MPDDWMPTRHLPIDAAPPKYLQGLEALVTAGIAVGLLLLDAVCAWLDSRTAEYAAGHGSWWSALSVVFATFALVLTLMALVYGVKWRKTWLGKISVVLAFGVAAGIVVVFLKSTTH